VGNERCKRRVRQKVIVALARRLVRQFAENYSAPSHQIATFKIENIDATMTGDANNMFSIRQIACSKGSLA
jgi:hypothetical protein